MSKEWDGFVPPPSLWREVYRVLKPGGHALVFAGTRTQDLMTISLRMAGFEVRDVIEWLYFSGFPKSHDVGKAFDRRRTEDVEVSAKVARFIVDAMEREGLTRRAISEHFNAENIAQQWTTYWTDAAVKPRVPKLDQWAEVKRFLNLSDEMDAEVWRLNGRKGKPGDAWEQREKVGESNNGSATGSIVTTGVGSLKREYDITAPATDLARKYDGWGTALKPAHEPIIVVRKPLSVGGRKATVADNVEEYGTGAINIDATRIGDEEIEAGRAGRVGKSTLQASELNGYTGVNKG